MNARQPIDLLTDRLESEDGEARVSKLMLDRYVLGELSDADAASVEAHLAAHPEARAHIEAIDAARADVPAFDFAALKRRADASVDSAGDAGAPSTPVPANNTRGFRALLFAGPALLMAALALLVAWPVITGAVDPDGPIDPDYVGVRGTAMLEAYRLAPEGLVRYDNRPLGEGDVVGFKVDPAGHDSVVVLSIDGNGNVGVHWPEAGDRAESLDAAAGPVALPGTLTLDGAPGPEVFVAVFDTTPAAAQAEAERAWQSGGVDGVVDWAKTQSDAATAIVQRK
jgi:hypothetical protein